MFWAIVEKAEYRIRCVYNTTVYNTTVYNTTVYNTTVYNTTAYNTTVYNTTVFPHLYMQLVPIQTIVAIDMYTI
jgi:hypothetical protein